MRLNYMLVYDNCLLEKFLSLLPYLESSEVDWGRNVVDVMMSLLLQKNQNFKYCTVRPGIRLRNKVFWGVALLLSTLFNPSDVVVDCA